jgi:hypothetical protein
MHKATLTLSGESAPYEQESSAKSGAGRCIGYAGCGSNCSDHADTGR